jgi:hypothetical protein
MVLLLLDTTTTSRGGVVSSFTCVSPLAKAVAIRRFPVDDATCSVLLVNTVSSQLLSSLAASTSTFATATAFDPTVAVGGQLSEVNVAVFIAGIIPFAIATFEFWRRIAVGDPFGTGSDAVVFIGEDDNAVSSWGQRVLGKGALVFHVKLTNLLHIDDTGQGKWGTDEAGLFKLLRAARLGI